MASQEAMTTGSPVQQEVVDYFIHSSTAVEADEDMYYGDGSEADVDDDHMDLLRMSRLSIQSSESDASTEMSGNNNNNNNKEKNAISDDDEDDGIITYEYFNRDLSLPGSPARSSLSQRPESMRPVWRKEYASETEARAPGCRAQKKRSGGGDRSSSYHWRSSRRARESRLERTWEMRRCHCTGDGADSHSGGSSPCVVVRPRGREAACMCMDMDEVRACRDLGLELPCDWTVEIPPAAFHAATPPRDTSSGGESPLGSWRISSPGEDPMDVKARLRVWAQAVALASASRLGG